MNIEVVRVGGIKGEIGCRFMTKDDSGHEGTHYTGISKDLIFNEGVTSLNVIVTTENYNSDDLTSN